MYILIIMEIFFLLIIGAVIIVAYQQKNFKLSFALNLAILLMIFVKFIMYIHALKDNVSMCEFSEKLFCDSGKRK